MQSFDRVAQDFARLSMWCIQGRRKSSLKDVLQVAYRVLHVLQHGAVSFDAALKWRRRFVARGPNTV